MGLAVTKQEAFWEACGFGNKERVRKFIEDGIDVNWVSYTHNSCAIHVASQGKPEIVQMLLKAGCNVNARDDRGNLALHHAAMKGHADIVRTLIEAGSEIDAQDKNGWTSLIAAAYFCQPQSVNVLLEQKCAVGLLNKDMRSALHETCRSPSDDEQSLYEIAKALIEHGADINSKSSDNGEADFTPLIFSAYHGHHLVAQALVDASCDVNAQDSNSWTALHWACDRNHMDVVRVLVDAGANLHITGRRGELAVDRTHNEKIQQLLSSSRSSETSDSVKLNSGSSTFQNKQLIDINSSIVNTAAEHRALIESQLSASETASSCSSSSAYDGDSCGDSKDLGQCDSEAVNKCDENCRGNTVDSSQHDTEAVNRDDENGREDTENLG